MKMQTQHFTSCILVIFFFIRTKQQELQKEQPLS